MIPFVPVLWPETHEGPGGRRGYEFMTVRTLLDSLKTWIDERLGDIANGRIANPETTIAWYWLKNAGNRAHFSKKDVVFECFHNFVAFSKWANTMFGIMSRLNQDGGDPTVRAAFEKTMLGNPDAANDALHADRDVGHGTVPHDLTKWREHFFYHGHPAGGVKRQLRR